MQKKLLVALAVLIPSFVFTARPLGESEILQCTQSEGASRTQKNEQESKVQERVYQVWCGGIF